MQPYSPETLAERWQCSAEKVRQMCRNGSLAYFRLGKLMRVPAEEVARIECTGLSGIEGNGASPTDIHASELRLARMTGAGPKLSPVKSGNVSINHVLSE